MALLDGFSHQLRHGVEEVRRELERGEFLEAARSESALAGLTLDSAFLLVRRPRRLALQDVVILAVARCCRHRPARLWAPVLLEMLAPALVESAASMAAANRDVDELDIQQQLVMEAIRAALTMPLPEGSRWVKRRLAGQAAGRTRRWLRRQRRHQTTNLPDSATVVSTCASAGDDQALWDLADLKLSGARAEDLRFVARVALSGEDRRQIAAQLGISYRALIAKYWRVRRRLRDLLVDEGAAPKARNSGQPVFKAITATSCDQSSPGWQVGECEAPSQPTHHRGLERAA